MDINGNLLLSVESMNLRNCILSGLLIGGGVWFVWVIFLIAKTVYANWFFMSLNPDLNVGIFSYNHSSILAFGLGILLFLGLFGGVLYYGFTHIIFNIREKKNIKEKERKEREVIKETVGIEKKKEVKKHTLRKK